MRGERQIPSFFGQFRLASLGTGTGKGSELMTNDMGRTGLSGCKVRSVGNFLLGLRWKRFLIFMVLLA